MLGAVCTNLFADAGRNERGLGPKEEEVAKITIDSTSLQYRGTRVGGHRQVPEAEMVALMTACVKLLERLNTVAPHVELIRVKPWYGHSLRENIFDIKVTFAIRGDEPVKLAAEETFENSGLHIRAEEHWNLDELESRVLETMERRVRNAIILHARQLDEKRKQWLRLLPQEAETE